MTTGGSGFLIDTNVLIYAYDTADMAKRARAIDVLRALHDSQLGTLSAQIVGEFYVNVTRKPVRRLTSAQARASLVRLCRSWQVLDIDVRIHFAAMRAVEEHVLSYWDAVVWATAAENRVPYILSEDQQHGRLVGEVRYFNPFDDRFDLAMLS
jgi:predicted nucleic acid-binding protein